MRKNFARVQTAYITLFILGASVAQAGPRGIMKPDLPVSWMDRFASLFDFAVRALDVLKLPLG